MSQIHRIRLLVILEDGTEHIVTTTIADRHRYVMTAQRQKWPDADTTGGQLLMLDFLAWAACKRTGVFGGTWDDFTNTAQHVEALDDDDTADPTQPANPDTSSPA